MQEGFSVKPKRDCPHLELSFNEGLLESIEIEKPLFSTPCQYAGCTALEVWLCLSCFKLHCSRYAQGHAATHYEEHSAAGAVPHCVGCSLSDLSFWCYSCDSYIEHDSLALLFSLLHTAKFGESPGSTRIVIKDSQVDSVSEMLAFDLGKASTTTTTTTTTTSSVPGDWWIEGLDRSVLSDKRLDRILGCLYGNALGDAFGLATEFMDKEKITAIYGDKQIPFPGYKRNLHNMRWTAGDWTDDTDQMILILETIQEMGGKVSEQLFARKLKRWIKYGFPDLGDDGGMGLGFTVSSVVNHPEFLSDPHRASKETWQRLNENAAANGAVMRCSVLGILDYSDLVKVIENTITICKVTHHDTRCVGSCVATNVAIALMLQEKHDVTIKEGVQQLIEKAVTAALQFVDPKYEEEFKAHIKRDDSMESLLSLKLDESESIGYTLKCVGSGFWGLCSDRSFENMINLLAKEGGDADTNGAVCGALYGTRHGYSSLPKEWLAAMPHKRWLDRKVVAFLKLLRFIDEEHIISDSSPSQEQHQHQAGEEDQEKEEKKEN